MKKKKVAVLHAQVPFVRGGAELMVENLTLQLKKRGFDAEIISMPFKWYPNNVLLDACLAWRMADITESNGEKIDLVIATKAPTFLARHPNKVTWLMHQHRVAYDLRDNVPAGGFNVIPDGRRMMKLIREMDNIAIPESKAVYSISKTVTDRLKHYNGLDATTLYHPPALEGRYYCEKMEDYILSVGRLDPNKRVDIMIRALQHCDKQIKVMIAGRGAEMDRLQKLAVELGVEKRVQFLGFVPDDDLLGLYANALGVCFTPIDEDYGYITLEAFLSKKPILTCHDSGGVLEFAKQNESAFITDTSPEEMGASFNRLYHNKKMAQEMGLAGYNTVKDISWDNVIDELTKTIR